MKLGSILLFAGIIALVAYFVLFSWVFRNAGPDGHRYVDVFKNTRRRNIIPVVLVIAAFVVSTPQIAITLLLIAVLWIGGETFLQYKKMLDLACGRTFIRRLT